MILEQDFTKISHNNIVYLKADNIMIKFQSITKKGLKF